MLKESLEQLEKVIEAKGSSKLEREGMTAEGSQAHEALEDFYDEFAAATNMAYVDDEGTRVMALRLIPRDRDRKRRNEPAQVDTVPATAPTTPTNGGTAPATSGTVSPP